MRFPTSRLCLFGFLNSAIHNGRCCVYNIILQHLRFSDILLLLWLNITLVHCLAGCSAQFEMAHYGHEVGLHKPYTNLTCSREDAENQFDKLVAAVNILGGSVVVANRECGIISWIDIGYAFHVPPILRTRFEQIPSSGLDKINLAMWHGFVHASARVKKTSTETRTYVKAIARDEMNNRVYCSDGNFESLVLSQQENVSSGTPIELIECHGSPRGKMTIVSDFDIADSKTIYSADDYWHLYFNQYKNLSCFSPEDVFASGTVHTIPATVEEVWEACLDLVWQYDGIAQLSADKRIVVFARSLSFLSESSEKSETKYVDVVFAIALRDNPKGGTELGIGWLSPPCMTVEKIQHIKSPIERSKKMEKSIKSRPECAADLSDRFIMELAVQLSWKGQLLNKLQIPTNLYQQ